ncbi:hypothetical protein L917_01945 [Phytophthora nicotianae]|uniref:Uncharacterized protein n=1 Tax=Phytophthora nicotianae TaxID=4792 RepID=W2LVH8_PHYNI|nr:hypothetical protein L917_01945 [Phytophthora nicotianae]
MTKQGAREPARPAQATVHWFCKRNPEDYVRSVHGFTRDPSSDEDYVDDPFTTIDDVANEEGDMESDEEIADAAVPNEVDVEAKARHRLWRTRDVVTRHWAREVNLARLSPRPARVECVDAGVSAATTVKDDAPESVADASSDSADPGTHESNVDEGDAVVDSNVDEDDANVEDGDAVVDSNVDEGHDENALNEGGETASGVGDFIREYVHARTDAEEERDKRKKRPESQRRKHAPN